jgi:Xaa-Pro aminopeptidase
VLLCAGAAPPRNYRANRYPFRATSHFLYLVGRPIPGAMLLLDGGRATLFTDPPDPADALWHGERPSLERVADELGLHAALDVARAEEHLVPLRARLGTLPPNDATTAAELSRLLGREVAPASGDRLAPGSPDEALADAMIALRLVHDDDAIAELRAAAQASARAHRAGMRASFTARTEAEVLAAMVGSLRAEGLSEAYGPIVTVHGEVLHHHRSDGVLSDGALLLADVGGETPLGWAADITRTWPVRGRFSPTQRDAYEVVLRAQRAAISLVRPGTGYRDVHRAAMRALVEGLRELGVLRGEVDGLLERNAGAVFFPHGIGHLLGLDVHDMEDLGDRAGYAPGRARSSRFGERYLRLDRNLEPGMAVTIEPGFYQVPAILRDVSVAGPVAPDLDLEVLARFADVRGIRIEDDVLVTADGSEVLSAGVPTDLTAVERCVRGDP